MAKANKRQTLPVPTPAADPFLDAVFDELAGIPDLALKVGKGLRKSFDEVIDGPRTGRFQLSQLEKTEKTYIGTKVEIIVRSELDLARGKVLDNLIAGNEVDTKFSLTGAWMIPREAVGQICLLIKGDDDTGRASAGLLRMTPAVLTLGANQDGKKNVSAGGKQHIRWLFDGEDMPPNFLLKLNPATRAKVLAPTSGKQRLMALFRNVTGQIIPRSAILQVAQLQGDPLKRAREAKAPLAAEGYEVMCATYLPERERMIAHGFTDLKEDDWLSIKI